MFAKRMFYQLFVPLQII